MSDELNQGLLAVYFHSEARVNPQLRQNLLRPIPIDNAVDIVASHSDPGSNHRMRCAAKLCVFSRIEDGDLVFEDVAARNLKKLDVPVEKLQKHFNRSQTGFPFPPFPPEPLPDPIELPEIVFPPYLLELELHRFWYSFYAIECTTEILQNTASFDPFTWTAKVYYRARISKPFTQAYAAVHDPQNWSVCAANFENSFVAAPNNTGDWVDANYDGFPKAIRPEPGSTWSDVLFEHFKMELILMTGAYTGVLWQTWFRNFLDIEATLTDTEYSFNYSLKDPVRSYVGPNPYWWFPSEIDGGLNLDNGTYRVYADPDDATKSLIEGLKIVRMSNRGYLDYYYNQWMAIFLRFMADEGARVACECNP